MVFIDEADSHTANVVVAGYVAQVRQWRRFNKLWRKALKKRGLSFFHTQELWDSDGEFSTLSLQAKEALRIRLFEIADSNLLVGFTIRINEADFNRYYIGDNPRAHRDSQYGLCLRWAFCVLPEYVEALLGKEVKNIHFILERGHRNFQDCQRIFEEIKDSNWEYAPKLGTFSGGSKGEFPGLEAGDALATGSAKAWDHVTSSLTAEPEDARQAIQVVGERCPVIRFQADEEFLRDLKQERIDYAKLIARARRARKKAKRTVSR